MSAEMPIESLLEAVKLSPDNAPLRRLLAQALANSGRLEEAEAEYRKALTLAPNDLDLRLGLANVFMKQDKTTFALLLLEEVVKLPDAPPRAFVQLARLLFQNGQVAEAVTQYKRALAIDPFSADPELSSQLGVRVGGPAARNTETPGEVDDDDDGDDPDDDRAVVDGRVRSAWEGTDDPELSVDFERPSVRFDDVGGMEPLKEEIRMKIIHPLEHAELYRAYGKAIGGGILLYGPPGCGKTHLARATAGEIRAAFMVVGINDVLEMWIGNSERNLHALFEQARSNRPCVLFFDEVDALAASRADLRASGGRQLINQFLAELDGIGSSNEGVLILAATNAPWHLDPAFRRPGRFDRILFVPPPDAAARASILRVICRDKPLQDVDFDQVAKKTDQFSGADLKALVDQTIEAKLRDAMKSGVPRPITTKDLLQAAGSIRPTTKEWFSTARNYAIYSNQGGAYDEILKYLNIKLG